MAIAGLISCVYQNKNIMELRIQMKEQVHENKIVSDMLTELKANQIQLIQKGKMASLGELTAGISHEIQNPQSFVNNFSMVTRDLIEDTKQEIERKYYEEVQLITIDLQKNEEWIIHNGMRLDAIVKSMLQHPRTISGQKEKQILML
jgi:C4-dicarboxylate-specific signal transduction histidine kinase